MSLALSPDGKTLALGTEYNTVHVWDLPAEREVYTLRGHGQPVHALAFSPDGKVLASGAKDGTICLWDLATGANLRAHGGPPHSSHLRRLFARRQDAGVAGER